MAKRFFDTSRIEEDWYLSLSCKHRELLRYCESKCDGAGVFAFNSKVASTYIGERITEDDLKKLPVEKLSNGKYLVKGFSYLQNGKLSETCAAHKAILKSVEDNGVCLDRLSNSHTDSHTDSLKVKEKEKEKEEEKESDSEKLKKEIVSQLSNNGRTPEQIEQVATERVAEFEKEFQTLTTWINTNTPRVAQMKEPFTLGQFVHLRHKIPDKNKIKDLLLSMHNWKDLHSKNVSAYLTILKWSKREN